MPEFTVGVHGDIANAGTQSDRNILGLETRISFPCPRDRAGHSFEPKIAFRVPAADCYWARVLVCEFAAAWISVQHEVKESTFLNGISWGSESRASQTCKYNVPI